MSENQNTNTHVTTAHEVTNPAQAIERARANRERHEEHQQTDHSQASWATYDNVSRNPEPAVFRIVSEAGRNLNPDEVNRDSVVFIGDQETRVGVAESVGLIERDGKGGYRLTEKGAVFGNLDEVPAETDPAPGPEANKGEHAPTYDSATEKAISAANDALANVPPEVVAQQAGAILDSGGIDVTALARRLGVAPEEAERRAGVAVAGFEAEASAHLCSLGIEDPAAFRAYAEGREPARFRDAVNAHIKGDLSQYDDLAAEFKMRAGAVNRAAQELAAETGIEGEYEVDGSPEMATIYRDDDEGPLLFYHPDTGAMRLRDALLRGIVRRG